MWDGGRSTHSLPEIGRYAQHPGTRPPDGPVISSGFHGFSRDEFTWGITILGLTRQADGCRVQPCVPNLAVAPAVPVACHDSGPPGRTFPQTRAPMVRTLAIVSALLVLGVSWLPTARPGSARARVPDGPPAPANAPPARGTPVGLVGCAATACHGGPATAALAGQVEVDWRYSATCWVAADPHRGAYSLLTDRPARPVRVTAREIVTQLGTGKPATEDARCLACHTNPTLAEPGRRVELRAEGVSCEACHGNAGGWLRSHTTWAPGERAAGFPATGMTPLATPGERAAVCVG